MKTLTIFLVVAVIIAAVSCGSISRKEPAKQKRKSVDFWNLNKRSNPNVDNAVRPDKTRGTTGDIDKRSGPNTDPVSTLNSRHDRTSDKRTNGKANSVATRDDNPPAQQGSYWDQFFNYWSKELADYYNYFYPGWNNSSQKPPTDGNGDVPPSGNGDGGNSPGDGSQGGQGEGAGSGTEDTDAPSGDDDAKKRRVSSSSASKKKNVRSKQQKNERRVRSREASKKATRSG